MDMDIWRSGCDSDHLLGLISRTLMAKDETGIALGRLLTPVEHRVRLCALRLPLRLAI